MEKTMFTPDSVKSVELNKAASKACSRLFPAWCNPPFQGELQKLILSIWEIHGNDEQIVRTGEWWLWIRSLFIENTITRETKTAVMKIGIKAAVDRTPIKLTITRSPELVHEQIKDSPDLSLPRTCKSLSRLAEITHLSAQHLPTTTSIILADLAITNLEEISSVCDIDKKLEENLWVIDQISKKINLKEREIQLMSQLDNSHGKLGNIITRSGKPINPIVIPLHGQKMIGIVAKESMNWHKQKLGWTEQEFHNHNNNLAITMGLVGQALKQNQPQTLLIHNESFISRAQLNNIFNDPKDPLPVLCLTDLLASKSAKS